MRRVSAVTDDVLEAAGVEIGRDLEHQRTARLGLVAGGDDAGDQIVQRLAPLQVAQPRGVGRGDVERQIVGQRGEGPDAEHIVLDAVGRVLVGAEVDADHAGRPALKPRQSPLEALIVEAEAVDDGRVLCQAEQPRAGVAGLWPRRQRADLDEAETELQHGGRNLGVLVEAGGEPERIGKPQPQDLDRQARIRGRRPRRRSDLQCVDRRPMGRLRRQMFEHRTCDFGQPHGSRLPKTWRPSDPSGSGRDQTTALIGKAA